MSPATPAVLTAIQRRTSVRSYSDRPVESELLERLSAAAQAADRLTAVPPRVAKLSGVERTRRVLTYAIGSYGLVQNPPHLLVGVLPEESELARLDLGYVLEQVVLEATWLGLSTCWIAGSFDPGRAGEAITLARAEVVGAVCALGYPAESAVGRFHTRLVRQAARGHRRRPLTQVVSGTYWGEPWPCDGADPTLVTVLEHARLAPSGTNRQPWRFIVRAGDVVLALDRPRPIDAGIVMAHVTLASAAVGRAGRWSVRWRDAELARQCRLPDSALIVGVFG